VHTNQSTSTYDKLKQNIFGLDPSSSIFAPRKIRKPKSLIYFMTSQWRSKDMANCTYARGANGKGTQNCVKFVFLSYNQIEHFSFYYFFVILFEIRRCCIFVRTTRRDVFYGRDEILRFFFTTLINLIKIATQVAQ
jgi:hypothetical protein